MFLATDLDGTFLGGSEEDREKLYRIIKNNSGITLTFVTGRSLPSVLEVLQSGQIPFPNYFICDVGARVVNGQTLEPILPLQDEIEKRWPGEKPVEEILKGIEGLVRQQVPQHLRVSYFLEETGKLEEIEALVKSIGCEAVYSNKKYLDILPKSVSKGSTLSHLVKALGIDPELVLVAGDTLNDLSMFRCGFNGVAVGNSEFGLVNAIKYRNNVYHAQAEGAGGILEYMRRSDRFSAYLKEEASYCQQ